MAPRPGASSSSTRASTRTPAGCTRRAASTMSTSSPRRSSRAASRAATATAATAAPLGVRPVTIRYRTADGKLASRSVHDLAHPSRPIVRSAGGRWIAFAMMNRPVEALQQSFLRTKATDLASFMQVAQLKANSSNNTIFADDKGEIAYLHPQFVPRRTIRFDYTRPVDGSDPRPTGARSIRSPSCPTSSTRPTAGSRTPTPGPTAPPAPSAPKPERFPKYMDMFGENFRGLHALNLLTGSRGWTLERLNAAAYDSHQPGFAVLIPRWSRPMTTCPKAIPGASGSARRSRCCATGITAGAADSVAQSLAMFWGDELMKRLNAPDDEPSNTRPCALGTRHQRRRRSSTRFDRCGRSAAARLRPLAGAVGRDQPLPAHLAGDRPAVQRRRAEHRRAVRVGPMGVAGIVQLEAQAGHEALVRDTGNSFVAVVEFGPRVRARAVTAGGRERRSPSPHFNDQALRYASGELRDVYFYPGAAQGPHRAGVPAGRVTHPLGRRSRELVRRADQPVEDARLVEQMPAVGDDVAARPRARPASAPRPRSAGCSCRGGPGRSRPGMPRSFSAPFEQLAFLEPAVGGHVMVLDPGDGDRACRAR